MKTVAPASRLSRLAHAAIPAAPLALVALPSAHAAIIYTNPADLTVSGDNLIFIDMGTNGAGGSSNTSYLGGTSSFRLSPYVGHYPYIARGSGGSGRIFETDGYARKFAPREFISGSTFANFSYLNFAGNNNDNWAGGTTGYLGVQFNGGSGTVNGWINVTFQSNGSLTVHDFAYESSGAGIAAGATASIPEPSTYAALAGLLVGCAALYAKRRRAQLAA